MKRQTPKTNKTVPKSLVGEHPTSRSRLGYFTFIEENYPRSIGLKDVAMATGYCPSYLTDLVRRCSGHTVNHWIIKCRIALACNLLQDTNDTVNQISEAIGYQNEGHFFRQFRQHCGWRCYWRDGCSGCCGGWGDGIWRRANY
jgi:AraC-like DNA-binding protein